jgi:DNA-binding transcriptional regulator YdaS (Cro superfamily)
MNEGIKEFAERAGGVVRLSLALGLSRAAVAQWHRVPAERVLEVERLTGISRYELRPDVFGAAPPCYCAPAAEPLQDAKEAA